MSKHFLGSDYKNSSSEDMEPVKTNDLQQKAESQQNELTVPDPNVMSSSLSPSEDYVIIDDSEQEKPVEKPDEPGLLMYLLS